MTSAHFFTEGTSSDGDSVRESQIRRRNLRRGLRITSSVSPVRVSDQPRSHSRVRMLRGELSASSVQVPFVAPEPTGFASDSGSEAWRRTRRAGLRIISSVSPGRSRSRSRASSPLRGCRSTSSALSVQVPFADLGPTRIDSDGGNEAWCRIRRRGLRITSSISPQRTPVRGMTSISSASAMHLPFTELIDSDSGSEDWSRSPGGGLRIHSSISPIRNNASCRTNPPASPTRVSPRHLVHRPNEIDSENINCSEIEHA